MSYTNTADINVGKGIPTTIIFDKLNLLNTSSTSPSFFYNKHSGELINNSSYDLTILVSGQLTTSANVISTVSIKKNNSYIVKTSIVNINNTITFNSVISLRSRDRLSIEIIQNAIDKLIIFNGESDSFVIFTELDYVQGPTGFTGPQGPSDYNADPLYWDSPLPTTTESAIDRMAKALSNLLGTKIPI